MIKNYFKIAWRNLWKNKIYSFINIFGLAIGLAVTITISLWVNDELNYNHYFKNRETIAQVFQSQTLNGRTGTGNAIPRPLEFALREQYGDKFRHIVMSSWTHSCYLKNGDINISKEGNYMQKGAPEMLDLEILKGVKNGLTEKNNIMLSASAAKALFGDADPIGKTVQANNKNPMIVTAVYKDIPVNNSFNDTDFLMSWEFYATSQEWIKNSADFWGNNSFQLFVQIAENQTMEGISKAILNVKKDADEDTRQYDPKIFLLPMNDWYLRSRFENGVQTGGRIEYVWLFTLIGAFVLLLACINFMNLSTARSEKRAKEVGIRKSVGSNRVQIIRQFLGESLFVVILAFIVAIAVVVISLGGFNYLAGKEIHFPWTNVWFWLISVAFILFTALISGSYPALYLSSFKPVKVLKGTFKAGRLASLPRKVLVVTQFTVSATLIIGTLIILKQIQYTKNRPVGYNKEGLIQMPTFSQDFDGKHDVMRNEFLASGAVINMATSSSPNTGIWSNRSGFDWDGKPEGFQEDVAWVEVSPDYAQTVGLKFLEGRDFSREFPTDSTAVILNKTAVKYMGIENPIGKLIRDTDVEDKEPPLKIVGVVEDMVMESPYQPVKQTWYVFDRYGNISYYTLRMNPDKSVSDNLKIIEQVFKKQFPHLPFQYQFVDEQYARKFASEERVASLAGVFTVLAILISCLGLFGLASFVAEQKTKEIGIRKVLGATVSRLWIMLSKDFIYLVIISLLIATPLAYYFMHRWIQSFSYRTDLSWWIFILSGGGALLITLITVSFQAIKAAIANPVKSLRTE
ncbi:ABC transporter permease [Abyssalbus ytuae]|uniref:ABC transporter permease n=1 Tax=Abyssalbus ytuae TaxID=2926907 RepID=A0A9E6ZVN5_9FLAO|nr:ABC transporter permease [Abyssalbus ytuae]UOB16072.1 ABC transporter permease [Abyssalbus ytuae]